MASVLHEERLMRVVQTLLDSGATSVLDLGCGTGELLMALRRYPQFTQLLGIDIDEQVLAEARLALGLDLLQQNERLQVRYGSFEAIDQRLRGFDAAVMLETIEHIDPSRLSEVEQMIFKILHLPNVIITTPNQDYNIVHGMLPGQRRHPGHRFEWTRAQFTAWADGIGRRQGYRVHYCPLGPHHPDYGSSSQMAVFRHL